VRLPAAKYHRRRLYTDLHVASLSLSLSLSLFLLLAFAARRMQPSLLFQARYLAMRPVHFPFRCGLLRCSIDKENYTASEREKRLPKAVGDLSSEESLSFPPREEHRMPAQSEPRLLISPTMAAMSNGIACPATIAAAIKRHRDGGAGKEREREREREREGGSSKIGEREYTRAALRTAAL